MNIISLVKLHYFQLAFVEYCVYKKQKRSTKHQMEFLFKHILKVFANSVSAHSKIWCSWFFYEQNDTIFFIPLVGNLPEIEECIYLTIHLYIVLVTKGPKNPLSLIQIKFRKTKITINTKNWNKLRIDYVKNLKLIKSNWARFRSLEKWQ